MLAGQKGEAMMKTTWRKYEIELVRTGDDGDRTRVVTPDDLAAMFEEYGDKATKEALFVAAFDGQNGVIGINKLYEGTATGTSVRIAEIFQPLLVMNAVGFALVHNHPSTNTEPSNEDIKLTSEVLKAAALMDLTMLDHIIIGGAGEHKYTSIRRENQDLDWQ
jgi:DNA repair protein RadC